MPNDWQIILGPPGTGKTYTLLGIVEDLLGRGVPPDGVAYLAFTKKAANEAIERATQKFNLRPVDLPFFRTIHSLAFRQLGLNRGRVMGHKEFKEFSELLGIKITGRWTLDEGGVFNMQAGDRMLFMENLARTRGMDLRTLYDEGDDDIPWSKIDLFSRALKQFKEGRGIYDYTDMLFRFLERGTCPRLHTLIVDEAQDLSRVQWRVIEKMSEYADNVIVAGDDDQAIFRWAGADVNYFMDLPGTSRVLSRSYRVPRGVQSVADKIIQRVGRRRQKSWRARSEPGSVHFLGGYTQADYSQGSHLILVRNAYMLAGVAEHLMLEGIIYEHHGKPSIDPQLVEDIRTYEKLRAGGTCNAEAARRIQRHLGRDEAELTDHSGQPTYRRADVGGDDRIWHDAFTAVPLTVREYLLAALRRGEKVSRVPRVRLSTIHGAKGGEAETVTVLTDMAPRTFEEMHKFPDDEQRVFYVAVTRARETLNVVRPETSRSFAI